VSTINIKGFSAKSGANFSKFVSEKLQTILDYDHESAKPTSLKFWDDSRNSMTFGGSNLKYKFLDGEVFGVTGGTITSFKAVSEGIAVLDITKLSLTGKTLTSAIDSGSTTKFLNTLLSGHDVIKATQYADVFWGGEGYDTLYGYDGNDAISGSNGADKLYGGNGNDTLKGDVGNDRLEGGSGADKLHGAAGADKLYGGSGADTFVFLSVKDSTVASTGRDTIYDFSQKSKDKIDLKAIDADTTLAKDQAFAFIGNKAFSKDAGELRYEKKGGDSYIHGDVNGDGKADFSILVDASITFTKADFIL
jgi:Ca2+-binding RTX toxin-like protein